MSILQYPASYESAPDKRLPLPQAIVDLRLQHGYENVYDRFLYTVVGQVLRPGESRTEPLPLITEEFGWTEEDIGPFTQVVYSGYTRKGDLLHIRQREDYLLLVHANVYTGELRLLHDLGATVESYEGSIVTVLTHGPHDPIILLNTPGEATGQASVISGWNCTKPCAAGPMHELGDQITKFESVKAQIFAEIIGAVALTGASDI